MGGWCWTCLIMGQLTRFGRCARHGYIVNLLGHYIFLKIYNKFLNFKIEEGKKSELSIVFYNIVLYVL